MENMSNDAFVQRSIDWLKSGRNAHPEVVTYEFINEPWIFGWRWQETAKELRAIHKAFADQAHQVYAGTIISGTSSSFLFQDVIEGYPEVAAFDALANHPYDPSILLTNCRAGDWYSDADLGMQIVKRNNLKYGFITEGGGPDKTLSDGTPKAAMAASFFVQALMSGWFSCNHMGGYGAGEGQTATNQAVAVLTYMVSDRPCLMDIWPYNELLWGGIFAGKQHITEDLKTLPRADYINSRWGVEPDPSNAADPTKVAVLFSLTGKNNLSLDNSQDNFTIPDTTGIAAYNMNGGIFKPQGSSLTLTLGYQPVYVVTTTLSVQQLAERIRSAKITNVTAVNMYALSLTQSADKAQKMTVRVENQMPFPISGTVAIAAAGGAAGTPVPISIQEGRLLEAKVDWPGVTLNPNNVYSIKINADVKDARDGTSLGTFTREHVINSAIMAKKTIAVDGNLGDWSGVTPVTLDNQQCDITKESNLAGLVSAIGNGTIVAKFYAAYDDNNIYFAADVKEPTFGNTSGAMTGPAPDITSPPDGYPRGFPGGIATIQRFGDAISIGLGCRPRVPHLGRQFSDPWCWKGQYYDTDYLYTLHASQSGDKVVQHWDGASPRRWGYQTDQLPEHKLLSNAQIKIARGATTVYEAAIPRSLAPLFDPSKMDAFRLSFVVINGESASQGYYDVKDGMSMTCQMQYTWGYGVFDHWNKFCSSFGPSWVPMRPAQTRWGIEGGTYDASQDIPEQTPIVEGLISAVGSVGGTKAVAVPLVAPAAPAERIFQRKIR
jgi:hypothetical protein